MAEPSAQPTDSLDRGEGPIPEENVQRQQDESPPLPPVRTPILLSTAMMGESSASSAAFPRVVIAPTTPRNSSLNDYDSIRTRYPRRGDSASSSAGGYYQQPPSALRGCRSLLRCVCFPIVVLTTLLAVVLFFLLIGVPFLLLLIGLLVTYYCCTSNPIPFRTLLRAMVGVDDWNGGVFDGTTNNNEPYNVTKEDIRKNIIRRLYLGPMEWKVVRMENNVGGDLSTLPRDHPGRVHWRNETSSERILVFSAPLGDASTSSSIQEDDTGAVNVQKDEVDATNTTLSPSEMLQRDESLPSRNKIPKYLQHHKEKENDKNGEEKEEEKDNAKLNDKEKTDFDPKPSEELVVEPVHGTTEASPSVRDDPATVLDDHSSVRDRGAVCDICLLEFETGEAVAWSPNPACNHAYHEDCITDWLLRKPTCPSCRQNFIVLPVIRQSGSDSSGVVDHTSSGEEDDDAVESSILRELANIDDSSTVSESSAQIQILDGLQPPTAANAEGDIEMGFTGAMSSSSAENFENN